MRVAVIGGGVAGLSFVRQILAGVVQNSAVFGAEGLQIEVFDKSRGLGGRCATRRQKVEGVEVSFDHGAQYFTAESPQFQQFLEGVREAKGDAESAQIEEWKGVFHVLDVESKTSSLSPSSPVGGSNPRKRWVGVPGQSQLTKSLWGECLKLSEKTNVSLKLHTNFQIHTLDALSSSSSSSPSWRLLNVDQSPLHEGSFNQIVLAIPPSQAVDILQTPLRRAESLVAETASEIEQVISRVKNEAVMFPSWALMIVVDRVLSELPFDGAFIHKSNSISWVARNSQKPERTGEGERSLETWIVHSTSSWAKDNLELTPEEAARRLVQDFDEQITGSFGLRKESGYTVKSAVAHRWRFAISDKVLPESFVSLPLAKIALCGDWCGGPRIEGAFLSGFHLASALLQPNPSASL